MTWCDNLSFVKTLLSLYLVLLSGCGAPTPTNIMEGGSFQLNTITISELKSEYRGSTHQIIDDVYIEARVVATDMFGELDGRMVLQDGSGGVEVYVDGDSDRLYESYKLYSAITLSCSGLWLAARGGGNGALVIGDHPTAYDPVDGISLTRFDSRVLEYATSGSAYDYRWCHLSDLTESLISSCVVMQSLSFVDDVSEPIFDSEQYEEFGYCRREMVCAESGMTINLYIPETIQYGDLPISQLEDEDGNYLVLVDRYAGNYSLQLVGMGGF